MREDISGAPEVASFWLAPGLKAQQTTLKQGCQSQAQARWSLPAPWLLDWWESRSNIDLLFTRVSQPNTDLGWLRSKDYDSGRVVSKTASPGGS